MTIPKVNSVVNVNALKHDNKYYRKYKKLLVIDKTEDYLVLYGKGAMVKEKGGHNWVVSEPMLWFFSLKDDYFNTTALIRTQGIYFYTNLASPPRFTDEGREIDYIDYDIDIKHYPMKDIRVIDQKDFVQNNKKYNYDAALRRKISSTTVQIIELILAKKLWFNKDSVDRYKHRIGALRKNEIKRYRRF